MRDPIKAVHGFVLGTMLIVAGPGAHAALLNFEFEVSLFDGALVDFTSTGGGAFDLSDTVVTFTGMTADDVDLEAASDLGIFATTMVSVSTVGGTFSVDDGDLTYTQGCALTSITCSGLLAPGPAGFVGFLAAPVAGDPNVGTGLGTGILPASTAVASFLLTNSDGHVLGVTLDSDAVVSLSVTEKLAPVPEPAALGLLGLGLLTTGVLRSRRRRSS